MISKITSAAIDGKPTVICCAGFLVTYFGDRSVGIFNQEWAINGEFEFESQVEMDSFKQKIIEAFEYCSDTPIGVETVEERNAKICAGW